MENIKSYTKEEIKAQEFETAIRWHLNNNVHEKLTEDTIDNIIETVNKVRTGKLHVSDYIGDSNVSVIEMLEDLRLLDFILKIL